MVRCAVFAALLSAVVLGRCSASPGFWTPGPNYKAMIIENQASAALAQLIMKSSFIQTMINPDSQESVEQDISQNIWGASCAMLAPKVK